KQATDRASARSGQTQHTALHPFRNSVGIGLRTALRHQRYAAAALQPIFTHINSHSFRATAAQRMDHDHQMRTAFKRMIQLYTCEAIMKTTRATDRADAAPPLHSTHKTR